MLRAYKYRLYPTKEQAELINKHIGSCRFIYNLALEVKNTAYASARKNISCFDLMGQLPELKKECQWLKEIDSQSLQQSIIDLDKAFTSFFKGHNSFPKFKSKHRGSNAFRNPHGSKVRIENGKLYQPKFLYGIRVVVDREHIGQIRSTTISQTPTKKYYVSVLCETGLKTPAKPEIKPNTTIGIDLGLSHFIITSNGEKIDNPKYLHKAQLKLKYLQRQLSKKKKGGSNRNKARHKVALQHEKITFQRKDFLHKLSSKLIAESQTLVFEDLNIKGMIKNHCLAQSISDAGWGMFVDMCKYKSECKGRNIIQLPTFEPSTKICSNCGKTNHTLTLKDREWLCVGCNILHDRDVNAAINIRNYALKSCGGVRREKPVELPILVGTMKQEVISKDYLKL